MRRRGPLRTAGTHMPLGDDYPNSVVFVCEDRAGEKVPVGTAFLIAVPHERGEWRYVVTARHVVEHGRPTWLRPRRRDGSAPAEVPILEWISHPTADAAVAPCDFNTSELQATFNLPRLSPTGGPRGLTFAFGPGVSHWAVVRSAVDDRPQHPDGAVRSGRSALPRKYPGTSRRNPTYRALCSPDRCALARRVQRRALRGGAPKRDAGRWRLGDLSVVSQVCHSPC